MNTKPQLHQIYVHPRWKRMFFEAYVETILWRQSIHQYFQNQKIEIGETAHLPRDQRWPSLRLENLFVFIFIQSMMGVMALISALVENQISLIFWLITSFIFSLTMFVVYKLLLGVSRGLKYFSRVARS